MIELFNATNIESVSNSVFSIRNLLVIVPFFIIIFFVIKKATSHKYTIIGFIFGSIIVPFSGGLFALLNSNTILAVLLFLFSITFALYKLKLPPYKLLIYPIFMLIVLLLILYAHFISPIILRPSQSVLEFYIVSAFIYAVVYSIIGFFIDKKKGHYKAKA